MQFNMNNEADKEKSIAEMEYDVREISHEKFHFATKL